MNQITGIGFDLVWLTGDTKRFTIPREQKHRKKLENRELNAEKNQINFV